MVLVVSGLLLSACSDEANTLDQAATERAVGRAVAAEVEPSVTSTRCAGSLEADRGATFRCDVVVKGAGTLEVEARQVNDEGSLVVTPSAAVVARERVASELKATLNEQFGRSFQVSCTGPPHEVRAPKSTSTCTARDRTSRRTITVTVTDSAGTLSFAVGPEAD